MIDDDKHAGVRFASLPPAGAVWRISNPADRESLGQRLGRKSPRQPFAPEGTLATKSTFRRIWLRTRTIFGVSAALLLLGVVPALRGQNPDAASSMAAALPVDIPRLAHGHGAPEFMVHSKPFLMFAGELGNSSAGTAAQADAVVPKLAKLHFNTILMPVPWEEIEPTEGHFDFAVLDHWIAVARQHHMHLVLLWFGSWKNGYSEYAPAWVKEDPRRFPRAIAISGQPTEIISTLGHATLEADSRAFAALMRHLRETDAAQQTVLMVQVENEMGFFGLGSRDRSPEANRLFAGPVPPELISYLEQHPGKLLPEIAGHFDPQGHLQSQTWAQVFGPSADEAFMAWHYARYVDRVAAAGEAEYPLPMYLNAQLPAPGERAGSYPSGGPHPGVQAIYQAAAPHITFYAPDIYWPNFEQWVARYQRMGNPAFVPESQLGVAPFHALYLYGQARGFGFSAFDVDALPESSLKATAGPTLPQMYAVLGHLKSTILAAQRSGRIRAMDLSATDWRPMQEVTLGGYLFRAQLARSWPSMKVSEQHGGVMVMEQAPNEFLMVGAGLTVDFDRDPDTDNQLAGIASIDQMTWKNGQWVVDEPLNGDQSNQGRQLLMNAHQVRVYRVRLFSYARE
jgi:hypothetical protein